MNNIEILFEDENLLFINKPSGLIVHGGVGTKETLVDWILEKYPNLREVGEEMILDGEKILKPGIVHRLDRETSGVMVLAKNQEIFNELKKHFQKRKINKEYRAFVYGVIRNKRGIISKPIGKSRSDFRKITYKNPRGTIKQASTEYVVFGETEDKSSTFVRFYPKTGRMHQIRVHAQSIQHPILCDDKYAKGREKLLGFNRLALHAYRISCHPHQYEKPITVVAPYPKDFEDALKSIKIVEFDNTS